METNANIFNRIVTGSNAFQQRLPLATKNNFGEIAENIMGDPFLYNDFMGEFLNLIGRQFIDSYSWKNPFGVFKTDKFREGKTIQEIALDLVRPRAYSTVDNNLFETYKSNAETAYHTVNIKKMYPQTIAPDTMRQALANEYGLNNILSELISRLETSSYYDEYQEFLQVIASAREWLRNVHVEFADPNNPTASELETLTIAIKNAASDIAIVPTGLYNYSGIPTATGPGDLALIVDNRLLASMDVKVLANAFNPGMVTLPGDFVIPVKGLPKGVYALLVDKNWFVAGDYIQSIQTFWNPKSLTTNIYFHHWLGLSPSPFMSAVQFSDAASTNIGEVVVALAGISAVVSNEDGEVVTTVESGGTYDLRVTPTGSITPPSPEFIVPGEYTVKITSSDGVNLTPKTHVSDTGKLTIEKGLDAGTVITLNIKSAYRNPDKSIDKAHDVYTATVELTVA